MRRIFGIILLLAGVALGIFWYVQRARTRALTSGDVFVREEPTDTAKPLPPSPAATPPAVAVPTGGAVSVPTAPATTSHPAPATAAAVPQPQHTTQAQQATAIVPAQDSLPRNPPNGRIYAGTGKYQLYRQGDITWRLNTDTGWACILFATDTQWSKPRVYQEGCKTGDTSRARGN